MTEEEIMDELVRLAMDWALGKEPVGATAEVTALVEADPVERVTPTAGVSPDRAFVVNVLLDYLDETEQWTTYSAWLRKRHSRLSTLKEELAAAGL